MQQQNRRRLFGEPLRPGNEARWVVSVNVVEIRCS